MLGPPPLLVALDLLGIFVFALSGGLVAVRKELDIFGVLVLAGTTGLGGGFLRDVLIGAVPPAALADWRYLLVPAVAGLVTFFFHPSLDRKERAINVLDAAGLALFCVTGALKAVEYGLGPIPVTIPINAAGSGPSPWSSAASAPVTQNSPRPAASKNVTTRSARRLTSAGWKKKVTSPAATGTVR